MSADPDNMTARELITRAIEKIAETEEPYTIRVNAGSGSWVDLAIVPIDGEIGETPEVH